MPALDELIRALGTTPERWSTAMSELLSLPVEVTGVDTDYETGAKKHGMTRSVRVAVVKPGGDTAAFFLKTPHEALYGETLLSDRARELAWRMEGYSRIPGHVQVNAVSLDGDRLVRVDRPAADWCLMEPEIPGDLLADRLVCLDNGLHAKDAAALATYLAELHVPVQDDGTLYRRSIRDTLMNATFRLIDSSTERWGHRSAMHRELEHRLTDWRIRLPDEGRLHRTHHDFHPWNIFLQGDTVTVTGARLPGTGDVADDLAALLVNYIWFSLRTHQAFQGAYRQAYHDTVQTYLGLSGNTFARDSYPPFLAKRLLVLTNPTYYPRQPGWIVDALLDLTMAVLREEMDALTELDGIAAIVEGPRGD